MRLLTLSQVAKILQCEGSYSPTLINDYCADSRLLKPGGLFFALKGERADGHSYLEEVGQKGALAAVVSKGYRGNASLLPLLFVDDPLTALQEVAKAVLSQSSQRVVAVTGSLGKTTTKEFIKTLLCKKFKVAASPGNSNSQVGLPLSILNHSDDKEEILVLEMGMTARGQISRLVQIAPPEVAVISTVSLVHACNFDTLEDIGRAKGEIFSHPSTKLGCLNREMPCFDEIASLSKCPVVTFSASGAEADYRSDPSKPNILISRIDSSAPNFKPLPVPGKHNLSNFLAAVATARHFKISWEEIQEAVSSLALPNLRLQFIRHKGILFLNDSYNAAEASVKAALETLQRTEGKGRKIAVLGSMLELGKFSIDCHASVGEFALHCAERMYCLGAECRPIYEIWKNAGREAEIFLSRPELAAALRAQLEPSDIVLLKGSRFWELWKLVEEI